MENMDFAIQTKLYEATMYFKQEMEKVYVRRVSHFSPFREVAYNPKGGLCYYLSGWALMGLDPTATLFRGKINLPERPGWKAQKDYRHGWVMFEHNGEQYIYDSLSNYVWPAIDWTRTFQPHQITFEQTQCQIIEQLIAPACSYCINEEIYQLKSSSELPRCFDNESSGYLNSVYAGAQIIYRYDRVTSLLATSTNFYFYRSKGTLQEPLFKSSMSYAKHPGASCLLLTL